MQLCGQSDRKAQSGRQLSMQAQASRQIEAGRQADRSIQRLTAKEKKVCKRRYKGRHAKRGGLAARQAGKEAARYK